MLSVDVEKRLGDFALTAAFEAAGGATALFGASGAGKTSLINMIAGLLEPDRGRIVLDGETLFDRAARIDVPPGGGASAMCSRKAACSRIFRSNTTSITGAGWAAMR